MECREKSNNLDWDWYCTWEFKRIWEVWSEWDLWEIDSLYQCNVCKTIKIDY